MQSFKAKTLNALGWAVGVQLLTQVFSFGTGIVLARLLVPDDFGLIAMLMFFYGFAGLLSNVGIGQALIQRKEINDDHIVSVFWLNIVLGITLGLVLYFSSGLVSEFFDRIELKEMLEMLAIALPISTLALVPNSLLSRELEFKYIKITELTSLIISSSVSIYMAYVGYGYWSLVVQRLAQKVVTVLLLWLFVSWRPKLRFSFMAIKELFNFSGSVFATSMLRYGSTNIDKLLIGKYIGSESLGIYDRANAVMLFPVRNISSVIASVMFPSMSRIQSEKERVKKLYLNSICVISIAIYPIMGGVFVAADSFVIGVLGPQWVEMVPVLRIFCIAGFITSITTVTGSLYMSQGAAGLQLKVSMLTIPIRIVGIIAGLNWGILGVSIGFTVSLIIAAVIQLTNAYRLIDMKLLDALNVLTKPFIAATIMAMSIYYIQHIWGVEYGLALLSVQLVFGLVIYMVLIYTLKIEAFIELRKILGKRLKK